MQKRPWVLILIIGFILIMLFSCIFQAIDFNNTMISLREMKKAELETTKVEYGQCIVKIMETNQVARAYRDDVMALASKAGDNLDKFNKQMLALIGSQVIPKLSPELRTTVQREIISCRNSYTGRVDLSLKPMYVNFNRLQLQFPNNIYNSLFFHWKIENLNMPKNESGEEIFQTKKIRPLELN